MNAKSLFAAACVLLAWGCDGAPTEPATAPRAHIAGRIVVRTGDYDLFDHMRLWLRNYREHQGEPDLVCDVPGGDTIPCWRLPVVAGRDTVYTDSQGRFVVQAFEPGEPLRLYVDESQLPRTIKRAVGDRLVRPLPPNPGTLSHIAFDTVHVTPTAHATTFVMLGGRKVGLFAIRVGLHDGTAPTTPLEGITVSLLASDTTLVMQKRTGDLGVVLFRDEELSPPGERMYASIKDGYPSRFRCVDGIGSGVESPGPSGPGWTFTVYVCVAASGAAAPSVSGHVVPLSRARDE